MTWAVTIDFHNTIATCDEWFQLEVYDLIPEFLEWHANDNGHRFDAGDYQRGRELYRKIRRRVMDTGIEADAGSCVAEVLGCMQITASDADIERGLDALFRPTVQPAAPVPGIIASVRELHARGVPLLVVSSAAYHPYLEWTLERFGIRECFQDILTSASCGHYKSAPRIYELAAEMLGRPPQACIHIGDSETFDVESAKQAGMRTVLFDAAAEMCGETVADLRVETLCGLPDRLVKTFGSVPHAV